MPGRRWVKAVLGLICLGLAVFWVWALFFPPTKESVVRITDRTWSERAEAICREANLKRDDLMDLTRIEDAGSDALARRADIIDEATAIVERMVDEILTQRPIDAEDARRVGTWETLFRKLIDDRRLYTVELRSGSNGPFAESAENGSPVSNLLNDFAVGNEMTSCRAPMDLAV
ncbi:MAG: hypothetical protein FJW09_00320 [Actinobacteria bacterium]|nr:hypothetical protein [Actinomycetota bacterium]